MNYLKQSLFFAILLAAGPLAAQLVPCGPGRTVWLLKHDSSRYVLEIKGQVRTGDQEGTILVDQFSLCSHIENKYAHLKSGEKKAELGLLLTQAAAESQRLSQEYGVRLKFGMEYHPLSEEKNALLWQVDLPEGADARVKSRVFASVVLGDDMIRFESPRHQDQSFEEVSNFLMEMISSVKIAPETTELCGNGN